MLLPTMIRNFKYVSRPLKYIGMSHERKFNFSYLIPYIMSSKFSSDHNGGPVKRTILHDFHVAHGGKMVAFAGWRMPVQYADLSIVNSHLHTRSHASIFDVSHMLQTEIRGKDCLEYFESMVVGDVAGLREGQSLLTLFTNQEGGILDDLIVTKVMDRYLFVVSNAACAEQDLNHMQTKLKEFTEKGKDVEIKTLERGLVSIQGPKAAEILQSVIDINLSKLYFMTSDICSLFKVADCRISRCGYTGEDGVEISIPLDKTVEVCEQLVKLDRASLKLAGLGARDSLRLEAGLCLYGNDIDQTTTPIDAALSWTIGKPRKERGDFPGARLILSQLKNKTSRKRVGIVSNGAPARAGTAIYDHGGTEVIGTITSGCPSPSLKSNVAMGYVKSSHSVNGTPILLEVRKQKLKGTVSKMPFVPSKYYSAPKN